MSTGGNALTTPSSWDISRIEGGGLDRPEDLFIILRATFPQGNVEIIKRDDLTYRMKLPYCTKLESLKKKLASYNNAVTIVNASADLSLEQTKRLAEITKKINDISKGNYVPVNVMKRFNQFSYTFKDNETGLVVPVKFRRMSVDNDLISLPKYMSQGSSGADLYAHLPSCLMSYILKPGQRLTVCTGISVEIPNGYEGQIRPRSGLAQNHGLTVLNSPGTIDSDYRGEIKVILINLGRKPYKICENDRIAQLVLSKVERIRWNVVRTFQPTDRGSQGLGSTDENKNSIDIIDIVSDSHDDDDVNDDVNDDDDDDGDDDDDQQVDDGHHHHHQDDNPDHDHQVDGGDDHDNQGENNDYEGDDEQSDGDHDFQLQGGYVSDVTENKIVDLAIPSTSKECHCAGCINLNGTEVCEPTSTINTISYSDF